MKAHLLRTLAHGACVLLRGQVRVRVRLRLRLRLRLRVS